MAARGVTVLDAPVSGTGSQAKAKDIAIYASGERAAYDRVELLLANIARSVRYVGEFGAGSKLKYIANLLVTIHNLSTAEAVVLAQKAGIDPMMMIEVVGDGAGASRMLQVRGPMMAAGSYDEPGMKLDVYQKDIDIIAAFAHEVGAPTPLFAQSAVFYTAALAQGRGRAGYRGDRLRAQDDGRPGAGSLMDLRFFAQNALGGLAYGSLLFLIASGLTLVFGLMRIINLAQTAFYLLGAYVGLTLVAHGFDFWLSSVAGGVVTMVLGLAVYSAFLHRYHADPLTSLLLTLGFALILDDGILALWGGDPHSIVAAADAARLDPDRHAGVSGVLAGGHRASASAWLRSCSFRCAARCSASSSAPASTTRKWRAGWASTSTARSTSCSRRAR